jgi:hypothetical protein
MKGNLYYSWRKPLLTAESSQQLQVNYMSHQAKSYYINEYINGN